MTDTRSGADLLGAAIAASGLSARRFAVDVLIRDERTIRRWIAGDDMPDVVREFLLRYLEMPRDVTAYLEHAEAVPLAVREALTQWYTQRRRPDTYPLREERLGPGRRAPGSGLTRDGKYPDIDSCSLSSDPDEV